MRKRLFEFLFEMTKFMAPSKMRYRCFFVLGRLMGVL